MFLSGFVPVKFSVFKRAIRRIRQRYREEETVNQREVCITSETQGERDDRRIAPVVKCNRSITRVQIFQQIALTYLKEPYQLVQGSSLAKLQGYQKAILRPYNITE